MSSAKNREKATDISTTHAIGLKPDPKILIAAGIYLLHRNFTARDS